MYNNTILPQETRKISNKQSNLILKANRERITSTPKVSRRKDIIKIRAETNEVDAIRKNRKDQWTYKLVLQKDKQNW